MPPLEFMKSAIASLNEPVVSCDAGLMLCVQCGAVRTMVIVTIERADAKEMHLVCATKLPHPKDIGAIHSGTVFASEELTYQFCPSSDV